MAPHSSTLAWKIPWMEEPGRLQSMGSLRVGHDWATWLSLLTFMHWRRNGNPLQCSCLENPRDGGAWWATVSGVAQSRTRLKRFSSSSSSIDTLFLFEFLWKWKWKSLSHVWLCDSMDYTAHGILLARIHEWVAFPFSNAQKWKSEIAPSCPTLRDPMDCSPPGSSVHRIFQARVLEWGAIAFSLVV